MSMFDIFERKEYDLKAILIINIESFCLINFNEKFHYAA